MFDMLVKRVIIQPAIPIPSVYQLVYRPDPPKRNTHVTQPKLSKSFKNSILVNPVLVAAWVHPTDRTPVSKVPLLVSNK